MTLPAYEALGSFYLGREIDAASGQDTGELLMYDSRDLTTHAVCVGMTGSGKTGLCLALLEEAAIDGVPAIVIDPKGDLGNLLLMFPELRAEDFAPWVDAGEAARKGMSTEAFAAATAETWRKGLAEWEQDGDRMRRLQAAAEVAIYTPGSTVGRPLSVLKSFAAPPPEVRGDANALRERVAATVGGLLGLIGVHADPLQSREHILLATLLDHAWSAGRDLDIAALIQGIQRPPFEKVGVFDVEAFYPAKDRMQLAMQLNNLIAAPGFQAWMEGEALDIQQLLFDAHGKPRISIISIAHLSDAERMFVVTLLLGEMVAWMRRQSGTSSLRALLYMDEIFGYFPPSAMPPSKLPLLTLMKQARAFGVGVVLATQNPVDLDYKGLSNAGTWFIGRLQTERDKSRVIEGLLSAGGEGLEKSQLEALLSGLGNRVFLMRNVHDAAPALFRTRWALSYLRGPMTLPEIARLSSAPPVVEKAKLESPVVSSVAASRPVIPPGIEVRYWGEGTACLPRFIGTVRLHFVDKAAGIDVWETHSYVVPLHDDGTQLDWSAGEVTGDLSTELRTTEPADARYGDVPGAMLRAQNYPTWRKQLANHAYRTTRLSVLRCPAVNAVSVPGGSESDFRARVALSLREARDAEIDKLRKKYAPRLLSLEDQQRRARERIERERAQLSSQKMNTAISVGTSLLGALLGRKKISASSVSRVGTAARSAARVGREQQDVARAQESLEVLQQRQAEMEAELALETERIRQQFDPAAVQVEQVSLQPRKSDIDVTFVGLLWQCST